ncbi:MAG TPA: asparagine synthetase B [Cyclobacteriaceae bacterium]|nr:asparagine synthetase B [Cyclobacteriaceae bacterium]HRJ83594.1 asparagine synthetase B [Cyclobacteriaceae bacterium]
MKKHLLTSLFLFIAWVHSWSNSILVPMDESQRNHLKAYGITYFMLQKEVPVDWLLNYRGGSFLMQYSPLAETECKLRGVSYEVIGAAAVNRILNELSSPAVNMSAVRLEKVPRIAVYSPKSEFILDETDAVILVLDYAEIPYDIIYDEEIHNNALARYDWVHLHHEDFTGQPGRSRWRESSILEYKAQEVTATKLGYANVPELKLQIAKKIKSFVAAGGYLFAMCSAAESIDVALAMNGSEIYELSDEEMHDTSRLDYTQTFAFENFSIEPPYSRRFSDINVGRRDFMPSGDYFSLFTFSAKWDLIPSLLTQNHTHVIREFSGLTTAFSKDLVKPDVLLLGENRKERNVRYMFSELGKGFWTFYSGHDPEGFPGRGRTPTDLNLHPNSPGYRLILNNVLFPSAQKKKQKT